VNLLSIIIIAVAVIIAIVFLFVSIKRLGLRDVATKLIVEAERIVQSGKGSVKFNYVFDKMYEMIPSFLQIFFTKALLVQFIQKVFDEVKIALDYQKPQV
jgi:hypothetical protein